MTIGTEEQTPPRHAGQAPRTTAPWGTVMLVDDDRFVSEAVWTLLQGGGATVIAVRDGLAAIDVFRTEHHRIDLVVLDLCLPGRSGLDVLEAIRTLCPHKPVVVTTAEQCKERRDAITGDPHTTLLAKPYLLRDLERSYAELRQRAATPGRY